MFERLVGDDAEVLSDRAFQVLLLASLSSPLGASVVSPILDSLVGPLGTSEARIGLLLAVFTAPAVLLIPVAGVVSDRYGRKPVLAAGLALFGAAGLAIALTTSFRVVLVLRFLQGVGYTGIAPVLIASVGDLYAGDREATAQGLRFATVGVSLTAFPLVSGLLVGVAWQAPFLLYGVALLTAVVVAAVFQEPKTRDAAETTVSRTDGDGDGSRTGGWNVRALAALARRPDVAATLVGRAVPSFVWFVFLTHNSLVVVRILGRTPGAAGAVVAAASVAATLGSTQVGRLTSHFDTRTVPLVGSTLSTALGVVAVGVATSLLLVGVGAVLAGAGFGVVLSLYRSSLTTVADDDLRGGLVSVGESIGRLGSTVAPLVLGVAVATTRAGLGFAGAVRTTTVLTAGGAAVVGVAATLVAARRGAV